MMSGKYCYVFFCILVTAIHRSGCSDSEASRIGNGSSKGSLSRRSFPEGFIFGTASSAYQYEGAAKTAGKGPSIWDTFTHKHPGKIKDGSNGDVAIDSYHRYKAGVTLKILAVPLNISFAMGYIWEMTGKEDVGIMVEMGLDSYRFSISWSRVLPGGKLSGGVNQEGIKYYNNLIDELLRKGIKPFVTLFHWDLPQTLEDEYGGFLSPKIVDDFKDYAELCFKEFGDRVKNWITLNEPWSYVTGGYVDGHLAPGRCSSWLQLNCTGGDSSTEPYIASHYQLLAHAAAVKLFKEKYQASQKGKIGITLIAHWMIPYSETKQDRHAAKRAIDFMFGWFMHPLTKGDYPQTMRNLVGERLPKFSIEESKLLKGSFDFLGLNYYTANYASHAPKSNAINMSYYTDSWANITNQRNGRLIGEQAASSWLCVYPKGFYDLLLYTKKKYNNPVIYITENGYDEMNNNKLSLEEALVDKKRVDYFYQHLSFLQQAIKDGVNVKGYFAWSLLDNFEWDSGYTVRFGINYVDYKNGLKRYPKLSAKWFKSFLKHGDKH